MFQSIGPFPGANDTLIQENSFDGGYHGVIYSTLGNLVLHVDKAAGFNDEDNRRYLNISAKDNKYHMVAVDKLTGFSIPDFIMMGN